MIPFNLTALNRPTPFIQRNAKTRKIFHSETVRNITPSSFIVSIFNQNSRSTSNLFSSITALRYFEKKAMAEMTTTFPIEEDEEPMATEPIYLSSDESEYSIPNTTPGHQLECFYSASINQLKALQLEKRSNMGTETVFSPPTPNTSMISDDEDPMNPTPILGNPSNIHCRSRKDAITQYNFANMFNLFQTRLNHHPRKIKVQETFPVQTILPMHRYQLRSTTPSISLQ